MNRYNQLSSCLSFFCNNSPVVQYIPGFSPIGHNHYGPEYERSFKITKKKIKVPKKGWF